MVRGKQWDQAGLYTILSPTLFAMMIWVQEWGSGGLIKHPPKA